MSDFVINSKIRGTYSVQFILDLKDHLSNFIEKDAVFIVDEVVEKLFELNMGSPTRYVSIICNEENKTIDYAQEIIRKLLNQNIRKSDTLIIIGGGIAQDLGAFITSILFRGINWKFYPSTLLSQCDSCIGSKSSINFDQYKNLLGTFNPPSEIFIYAGFLETLSESEIRSGIGEMFHYFLTEGTDLAKELSEKIENLLLNRSLLLYFIKNSLRIKKKIIEIDEFDTSIRHIFNYGHTFGHAIESITKYEIPHGQAVTIGIDIANFISLSKTMISKKEFDEMHNILSKNIVPFVLDENNISDYMLALSKDKKNKGTKLGCILSHGFGKVEKVFIDMDESVRRLLIEYSKIYAK